MPGVSRLSGVAMAIWVRKKLPVKLESNYLPLKLLSTPPYADTVMSPSAAANMPPPPFPTHHQQAPVDAAPLLAYMPAAPLEHPEAEESGKNIV
uniref:Uncharacterized protein n=1 Tax=Ditylenchus dipsaci TaxID=166011 RepID=A0A915DJG9_9BILA